MITTTYRNALFSVLIGPKIFLCENGMLQKNGLYALSLTTSYVCVRDKYIKKVICIYTGNKGAKSVCRGRACKWLLS
jgi:hypothetical protein